MDYNDTEQISTQMSNKLSRFYIDLNGELQQKGDNLWGLFSGVTKFTTHSLGKDTNESKMFNGVNGKKDRQIFKQLVELV